ncbi:MAG: 16S rRNA (uracil(1498)-N(3))-methyltransferase [Thermodesulfobacteriota bacterium]
MRLFYLEPERWSDPWVLDGAEARHALKAVRLGVGDGLRLFDGCGREGEFRIVKVGKDRAELEPVELREAPRPEAQVHLALGWSRQARRSWLLEKAVELGAAGLWFWRAERSQGDPPDEPKEGWIAKMIAGAKQSGNLLLPETGIIEGGLSGLVEFGRGFDRRRLCSEAALAPLVRPVDLAAPGRILVVVGPEGGLTCEETMALKTGGFMGVSLGQGVLRWETAALAALGLAFWARAKGGA